MKLTRLRIEDFRKFAGTVVIDDFRPGLNLFAGANEAGKTTIANAVRTLFLERAKSTTLKHLTPWNRPAARPQVEADFVIGPDRYTLRKTFVSAQRCELIRHGKTSLDADAAEEHLAELMRFTRPAKGTGNAEHYGVPGLLWITQGQAQEIGEPVGNAAKYLRDALAQLSGAHMEGGEDVLIGEVRRKLAGYVTEQKQRPTGEYAAVIDELGKAREKLAVLTAQQKQFEDDVERMIRMQADYDATAARKPWDALERQAAEAATKTAELRTARNDLKQMQMLNRAAQEKIQLLEDRCNDTQLEAEALVRLKADVDAARAEADVAASDLARTAILLAEASSEQEKTSAVLALAQEAASMRETRERLKLRQQEFERLGASVSQANLAAIQIEAASRRMASTAIDAVKVRQLIAVEEEMREKQSGMQLHGTRIDYDLQPGATVCANGRTLTGKDSMLLGVLTDIELPGIGRIRITVGAADMVAMSQRHEELRVEQAALLADMHVTTSTEAKQRQAEHEDCMREVTNLRKVLNIHAPNGIAALEAALQDVQRSVHELADRVAGRPDPLDTPTVPEARAQLHACTVRVNELTALQHEHFQRKTGLAARAETMAGQLESRKSAAESPETRDRHAAALMELEAGRSEIATRNFRIEETRKVIEALECVVSEGDVERLSASATAQRTAHSKAREDLVKLGTKLETSGAAGLGEDVAKAAAAVEYLERRHAQLKRHADALILLLRAMEEERDAAVRRLQAPLAKRLDHYFRRAFPMTDLSLDESLCLAKITRNGAASDLQALSFGTQEQFGILARLAYADLLQEAGIPTLVILDDCCVHTDEHRRKLIKRALLDAAERHQILLFTCHPESWNDLGIAARRIEDFAAAL